MVIDEAPPAAKVWAEAAAAVLAKVGRALPDDRAADPMSVAAALAVSTTDGVEIPALGSPFLTPNVLPVTIPAGPPWDIRSYVDGRPGRGR